MVCDKLIHALSSGTDGVYVVSEVECIVVYCVSDDVAVVVDGCADFVDSCDSVDHVVDWCSRLVVGCYVL